MCTTFGIKFKNVPIAFNRHAPEHVANNYNYESYHGSYRDNVQNKTIYWQRARYYSVVETEDGSFDEPYADEVRNS